MSDQEFRPLGAEEMECAAGGFAQLPYYAASSSLVNLDWLQQKAAELRANLQVKPFPLPTPIVR